LVPGARKCVGELIGMLKESARDFLVRWVEAQRKVRGQHRRSVTLGRIMGIGDLACTRAVLRCPLICTSRAPGEFPVVLEEILEEVIAPLRGSFGPGDLETAADCVTAVTFSQFVLPSEALVFDFCALGFCADVVGRNASAVSLAERVAAGN